MRNTNTDPVLHLKVTLFYSVLFMHIDMSTVFRIYDWNEHNLLTCLACCIVIRWIETPLLWRASVWKYSPNWQRISMINMVSIRNFELDHYTGTIAVVLSLKFCAFVNIWLFLRGIQLSAALLFSGKGMFAKNTKWNQLIFYTACVLLNPSQVDSPMKSGQSTRWLPRWQVCYRLRLHFFFMSRTQDTQLVPDQETTAGTGDNFMLFVLFDRGCVPHTGIQTCAACQKWASNRTEAMGKLFCKFIFHWEIVM